MNSLILVACVMSLFMTSQSMPTDTVCNEICSKILSEVCGSDGIVYPNKCVLEAEACKTRNFNLVVGDASLCTECNNKRCNRSDEEFEALLCKMLQEDNIIMPGC